MLSTRVHRLLTSSPSPSALAARMLAPLRMLSTAAAVTAEEEPAAAEKTTAGPLSTMVRIRQAPAYALKSDIVRFLANASVEVDADKQLQCEFDARCRPSGTWQVSLKSAEEVNRLLQARQKFIGMRPVLLSSVLESDIESRRPADWLRELTAGDCAATVTNLPNDITEDAVKQMFRSYNVVGVKLVPKRADAGAQKSLSAAVVRFASPIDKYTAVRERSRTLYADRNIEVINIP